MENRGKVKLLVGRFASIEEITKKGVKDWMDDLGKKGKGPASQKRILSSSQNFT